MAPRTVINPRTLSIEASREFSGNTYREFMILAGP